MSYILSRMVCDARGIDPPKGQLEGVCVYCGQHTSSGFEFQPSGQFTTYQMIVGGTVVCPYCQELKGEKYLYRASMWWVNGSEFRMFKNDEAEGVLRNPPSPPFQIFFTRTWKKPGWINLVNRVNLSKERFIVGLDYDLVDVDAAVRDEYLDLIHSLLDMGVSKTELAEGVLKSKSYAKVDFDLSLIKRLESLAGDPLWDLCVYVANGKATRQRQKTANVE